MSAEIRPVAPSDDVLPIPPRPSAAPAGFRPRLPIERTVQILRGPFRPLVLWAHFWGGRWFSELMRHVRYSLSPLGETLRPVVGAMYEWGLACGQPRRPSQERTRAISGA